MLTRRGKRVGEAGGGDMAAFGVQARTRVKSKKPFDLHGDTLRGRWMRL